MELENLETDHSHRKWLRFRLRSLLILITFFAVVLGWVAWERNQIQKEQVAVSWILEMGGKVKSTHRYQYGKTWSEKLRDYAFGESVRTVSLYAWNSGKFKNRKLDLSLLKELKNLRELLIYRFEVDDLTALAELNKLDFLHLEGTSIQDISPLSAVTELVELSLEETQVTDLTPLGGLKKLEKLHLADTRIDDVSALAGLTNLEYLDLLRTQVSELSPLWNLENLEIISIMHTPVSKEEERRFNQALPNCRVFKSRRLKKQT